MTPTVWPKYSAAFFLSAIGYLAIGIGLGLYMSATHDITLRPVHAHINLLGWVTSAIMGLFYAQVGARLHTRLIWLQFGLNTFGVLVGMAGLAALLTDTEPLILALPIGLLAIVASVLLFAWMVVRAARTSNF